MAKKRKVVQEPVLYITQPPLKRAEASMQASYHSPKTKQKAKDKVKTDTSQLEKELRHRQETQRKQEDVEKVNLPEVEGEAVKEEVEPSQEKHEPKVQEQTEKQLPNQRKRLNKRQRFKEMPLEDKVNYFVNLPSQIPKMKCVITAGEEVHRGIIYDYKDHIVYMRTGRRPFKAEIPFETIEDIQLLGF